MICSLNFPLTDGLSHSDSLQFCIRQADLVSLHIIAGSPKVGGVKLLSAWEGNLSYSSSVEGFNEAVSAHESFRMLQIFGQETLLVFWLST